ncbi:MAG: hypothetical protein IKI84_14310 [Clostridia bacterium]|nr:hypothetical protein [Clostridia bacterium]
MSDVFFFAIILFGVAFFAVKEAKKTMKKQAESAGKPAKPVPSTQGAAAAYPAPDTPASGPAAPAAAAPLRPSTLASYTPGFVSLEGQAAETDWHDAVMTGEGTDPCHDEMYAVSSVNHGDQIHAQRSEETREWAKAVVMAEIMKRPAERRWGVRGRQ